jgi:hypothetical protein
MSESYDYCIIYILDEDNHISIAPLLSTCFEDALNNVHRIIKRSLDEKLHSTSYLETNVSKKQAKTETGVEVANIENGGLRYFVKVVRPHWM